MTDKQLQTTAGTRSAPVMLPLPFEEAFDYRLPVGLSVEPGSFVSVPLGSTQRIGVVWPDGEAEAKPLTKPIASDRLKDILEVLDLPPVPEVSRKFVSWAARYTMAPLGSVLRMVMGSPHNLKPDRPINGYELAGPPPDRMTSARERVIDLLLGGPVAPCQT
ncbi:MAG: hypothetical protein E2O92_07465 [Alphaproteobacteria bacterium]|nr:MAG: hypothetical protein E2O92_07465 [Alphaproteobacteria bacterium]